MKKETLSYMEKEKALAEQFLDGDSRRQRAYICSPLSAETDEGIIRNMHMAREYMLYASSHLGYAARAPHAYLPMLLCDRLPNERSLALSFGMRLLEESDVLMVCGNRISPGMKKEIIRAAELRADIIVFSEKIFAKVKETAVLAGGSEKDVFHEAGHPLMAGLPEWQGCPMTEKEYNDLLGARSSLCGYCREAGYRMDCLDCHLSELAGNICVKAVMQGLTDEPGTVTA